MRAVVCATPGPIDVLKIKNIPVPSPQSGQVLIKVLGFGINRAGTVAALPNLFVSDLLPQRCTPVRVIHPVYPSLA